jgi:hypothetical protein
MGRKRNVCTISNCDRFVEGHGFCRLHYYRWRKHGDPLKVVNTPPGVLVKWIMDHRHHTGTDCLIWPFSRDRNGYGQLVYKGKKRIASRLMCELVNGNPPSKKHQAAHLCGNGATGCTNPKHIVWATVQENAQHKFTHGTVLQGEKCPAAKLTEADVVEIYHSKGSAFGREVAEKYDVCAATIHNIWSGRSWSCVTSMLSAHEDGK